MKLENIAITLSVIALMFGFIAAAIYGYEILVKCEIPVMVLIALDVIIVGIKTWK